MGSRIDPDRIGRDIANAIRSLTGSPCQVIVNSRDKVVGRMAMFRMRQQMNRNQIELMPR